MRCLHVRSQRRGRRVAIAERPLEGIDRRVHGKTVGQLLGVDERHLHGKRAYSSPRYAWRIWGSFSSTSAVPLSTTSPVWIT